MVKSTPKKKRSITLTTLPDPALQPKAERIAQQLSALYPAPPIPLAHSTPFQLLVAVILSAQSTDKKVNEITPALFAQAPDAAAMANLQVQQIEHHIRVLGLAPTKARNLKAMSQILIEKYDGHVPQTFQELEDLPGVGHKTASVIMSQVFGHVAFPVDTHIHRLAQRWGLTEGRNVEQTEQDLKSLFPESSWRDLHLQLIYFGREHCPAQRHDPALCHICSWAAVAPYDRVGVSPLRPGQRPAGAQSTTPRASKRSAASATTPVPFDLLPATEQLSPNTDLTDGSGHGIGLRKRRRTAVKEVKQSNVEDAVHHKKEKGQPAARRRTASKTILESTAAQTAVAATTAVIAAVKRSHRPQSDKDSQQIAESSEPLQSPSPVKETPAQERSIRTRAVSRAASQRSSGTPAAPGEPAGGPAGATPLANEEAAVAGPRGRRQRGKSGTSELTAAAVMLAAAMPPAADPTAKTAQLFERYSMGLPNGRSNATRRRHGA